MRGTLSSLIPVNIGWPYPPAPINAPSVAVPTFITAEVFIPARMDLDASGSSIFLRITNDDKPSTIADSFILVGYLPTR